MRGGVLVLNSNANAASLDSKNNQLLNKAQTNNSGFTPDAKIRNLKSSVVPDFEQRLRYSYPPVITYYIEDENLRNNYNADNSRSYLENYINKNRESLNIPPSANLQISNGRLTGEYQDSRFCYFYCSISKTYDTNGNVIEEKHDFVSIGFMSNNNTVSIMGLDSYKDLDIDSYYLNDIANPFYIMSKADLIDQKLNYVNKIVYKYLSNYVYNYPKPISIKDLTFKVHSSIEGETEGVTESLYIYSFIPKCFVNGVEKNQKFDINLFENKINDTPFSWLINSYIRTNVYEGTPIIINDNKNVEYKDVLDSILSELSNPFFYVGDTDWNYNEYDVKYISYIPQTAKLTPKLVGVKNNVLYFNVMSDKYYLSKYKIENSPREFRVELHGYNTGSEVIEPPKWDPPAAIITPPTDNNPDASIPSTNTDSPIINDNIGNNRLVNNSDSSNNTWIFAGVGVGVSLIVIGTIIGIVLSKKKKEKSKKQVKIQQHVRTNNQNVKTISTSRVPQQPPFRNPPPSNKVGRRT